jgi:hypothetical protein
VGYLERPNSVLCVAKSASAPGIRASGRPLQFVGATLHSCYGSELTVDFRLWFCLPGTSRLIFVRGCLWRRRVISAGESRRFGIHPRVALPLWDTGVGFQNGLEIRR